jgi:hypothetical protein
VVYAVSVVGSSVLVLAGGVVIEPLSVIVEYSHVSVLSVELTELEDNESYCIALERVFDS